MMATLLRSHLSLALVLGILLITGTATPVYASLEDNAGIWSTQTVEPMLVTASGVEASIDLGPARTAALGHLDSDGVVDLVVGHGEGNQAFAVVTLGDPRFRLGARHDQLRELDGLVPEQPFASEAVVYPLPFAPDWAAVGDYDADGDFDVVFAARGLAKLFWMAGDGHAGLDAGHTIKLSGGVTAFISGEVNRPDGLTDLVVAVHGANGSNLVVFESPLGALRGDPELHTISSPITSLALEWFDDDGWPDIAAAAGDTVVVVSGRDRRLTLKREKREAVAAATKTALEFERAVTGIAAGDFVGRDQRAQLAVRLDDGSVTLLRRAEGAFQRSDLGTLPPEGTMISARNSGLPGHDLVVTRPSIGRVELFHAESTKASGPKLEPVPAPDRAVTSIITGRLNVDSRDDMILLCLDGTVQVAASKSRIAIVVDTTDDIDNGGCQYQGCSLREAIISANIQPAGSTITFDLGIGATIHPTSELPALTQPASTVIDGTVTSGIVTGLLRITGDLAGTDVNGLVIEGGNATVSNFTIGGFDYHGISLRSDNNTITGCRIGLDETGGIADPNNYGIFVSLSADNTIGGTANGDGNVISGNTSRGISEYAGDGSVIMGNLIGLDQTGNAAVPNTKGILTEGTVGFRIGSAVPGGGNVISGNLTDGLDVEGTSDPFAVPSLILGNTIGLDPSGILEFPNGGDGIQAEGSYSLTIGGPSSLAGNVVSGNSQNGINLLAGSVDVQIQGNSIGTDPSGTVEMGNTDGIRLDAAEESTIGGAVSGTGNLISGNRSSGLSSAGAASLAHHIDILGNLIGPAIDGSDVESRQGITFAGGQIFTIGTLEAPNTIAWHLYEGIEITEDCVAVFVGPNTIHSNARTGGGSVPIDLGGDGVTPNDPLDADSGPNELQNFPEIEFVDPVSGDVDFYVRSTPSSQFVVHFYESPFCHDSGYGEGRTYLGSMTVTTEANGEVSDQVTLGPLSEGAVITATADGGYGTSEFSACFDIPYPPGHIFSDGFESGYLDRWSDVVGP
jgi:CSLREA domain-containing protein